jgi:hypothetical protein
MGQRKEGFCIVSYARQSGFNEAFERKMLYSFLLPVLIQTVVT